MCYDTDMSIVKDASSSADPCVIYGLSCVCHPRSGIRYVGLTSQGLSKRMRNHFRDAFRVRNTQPRVYDLPLYRWIRKHSQENIIGTVLEVVSSKSELGPREVYWISKLGTNKAPGLNIGAGGIGQRGPNSEATREKLRVLANTPERREKASHPGETHPRATLTDEEVSHIKKRLWNGESIGSVATSLGHQYHRIQNINSGASWASVPWPIGPRRNNKSIPDPKRRSERILGEDDVRSIRRDIASDTPYATIQRAYGISKSLVAAIKARRVWKHVD